MITLKNVNFSYGHYSLFESLSVNLDTGKIYGLLGKNGAGKTTLLKLIAGLRYPDEGECLINKVSSSDRDPNILNQLCFIPEEIWMPDFTITQYINLYGSMYPNFSKTKMAEFLTEFEIPNNKRNMKKMSLGQKKKVLLAFGLASGCDILILDEPTNGLDIPSKNTFRRLIKSVLNKNQTIIVSTHQVRDLEDVINPIVILDKGKIIFNQDIHKIRLKLQSKFSDTQPTDIQPIYSQKITGGYILVSKNTTQKASNIDLETIFSIVTQKTKEINQIFGIHND